MNFKHFKDFLLTESLNDIQKRIKLLILNSYLYEQSINESFSESEDFYKGLEGLSNEYKIDFDKSMKSSSILKLEDFESKYLDKLSTLHSSYKKINWWEFNDADFIVELDRFINLVYRVLYEKIMGLGALASKKDLDLFSEEISIKTLKNMVSDFISFRKIIYIVLSKEVKSEYVSVIGNEVKRIKDSVKRKLPEITLDIESLEESGCDIYKGERNGK